MAIVVAAAGLASLAIAWPYVSAPQYEPLTMAQRLVGCPPIPVSNGPLPILVGLASAGNESKTPDHWFNLTLIVGPSNLSLRYFWLNLTGPNSTTVTFPPGEGLEVISHKSRAWEATFDPGSGWTYQPGFGPGAPVRNGDLLSIFWAGPDPATVAGDTIELGTPCGSGGLAIT